jgi:hypothetical protein
MFSALRPKADSSSTSRHDRFVPKSDIAPVFINMSGTNVLIDNDHNQA